MNTSSVEGIFNPPSTYQDWLECLEAMKTGAGNAAAVEAAVRGSFNGSEATLAALQKQIIDTVNHILNKSAKRFVRDLNECLEFNDLTQIELLFLRLKKDVHRTLFFQSLIFLPADFRFELSDLVKKQMNGFWKDIVKSLYDQSLEISNSQLEDALFLIKRIHLFE